MVHPTNALLIYKNKLVNHYIARDQSSIIMNASFLYHALGVREQECTRVRYEDNSIIFDIQTRSDKLRCPCCQCRHIIRSG